MVDDDDSTNGTGGSCPVCQQLANKQCSGCYKISYCSAEHQKRHWRVHKNECRIFAVKRNDLFGRYLIATRDIPQGTIIFTEEPLAYGPKRITYPVCLGCHKRVDGTYRCSKCTYPMCSEECERKPLHAENECVVFQRGAHPVGAKISGFDSICPAYESVTPLRCLLLKQKDPAKWEKLRTMEHHNELRKGVPWMWNRNAVNVVKLLLEWYRLREEEYGLDDETVHSVMGYVDVNCFVIKYRDVEMCGVYHDAGLMNHDCIPNTHTAISMTNGHRMIVRSSIPIRKGEMITISYSDQLAGTLERRSFLKDTKYFDCLCTRCQDPTEFATYISGVKCGDCTTGYLLPRNPTSPTGDTEWVCTNTCAEDKLNNNDSSSTNSGSHHGGKGGHFCRKSMKEEQIQTILRKASKDIDEVSRSTAGSTISRLERLLKKYSGKVLHPNHYLLLNVIKSLNYAYAESNETAEDKVDQVDLDHLNRSKVLSLQLLSVLDMIDPGLTRLRGVTLFQLSFSDFLIAQAKFHQGEINEAAYKENVDKILAYLKTSRDILQLDKIVTPNAIVYGRIMDQIEKLEALSSALR